jgi:hypothetical protein
MAWKLGTRKKEMNKIEDERISLAENMLAINTQKITL